LKRLPDGVSEIYLHPALPSHTPIAASMPDYRHGDELRALMSPSIRDAIAGANVICGGYMDCASPPATA